ncbi:GNAT family N-acetyltransferase [Microbacterium karelineae]|uniref:GNAT family N-acetyltransferase n=1 Tax=Microbacterium karelineae TaxID=2654283 RepID=UPI0012EAEB6B|nr:GNAT family N-acetyltransferase [Microbacterium karelineae]
MTFDICGIGADDWRPFREIRLRMLADTPIAYGETLAHARELCDDDWRARAARNGEGRNIGLAAVADDGTWLGIMRGYVDDALGPVLVSVFVDPAARGENRGVADALLDGIVAWAREEGRTLTLHVHADNPRAIAFYRRRGFRDTGTRVPYELPPFGDEIEMRLAL